MRMPKPDNVHNYTMDRPPAESSIIEVATEEFEQIATFVIEKTCVPVEVIVRDPPYHEGKQIYWK